MKRLLVAVLLGACCASPAPAGQRENALKNIAQAFAAERICSRVEITKGSVVLAAAYFGIDFDRDRAELMTEITRQIDAWKGKPEDAACVAALLLYGPNGTNVRNLIHEK
ncbi:hypothetical protein [Rhizobium sp. BK602]|uniref:hypothetical protein n=1 Tax=Rhizobium sp. BK602 TaxID=2586986 RepID=UPI00161A7EDC|nr:hypothetical protein [Rhizobium sp. BK602]MBB3608637.1 hypothetical protein [Rhizobium sp. BK602]